MAATWVAAALTLCALGDVLAQPPEPPAIEYPDHTQPDAAYAHPPLLSDDVTWNQPHWDAPDWSLKSPAPPNYYLPAITRLGLRHSFTHGRHVGLGGPLHGTSWLNRPFYFGGELGTLWMTRSVDPHVNRDTDMFGGIYFGWDWDQYWGGEVRYDRATPELRNRLQPDAPHGDTLTIWNYSMMYYPWGDSTIRPYWRWGIGNTKVDFPTELGERYDEWLLTFPIGVGVKYPIRRWLAARVDLTDHIGVGSSAVRSQHNVTLTFGLEWRFGARPKSYWPWHPSRHIW